MATTQIGFANISGLAADTKPTTGIGAGSTFYETDTKKSFIYDGTAWNETGGSGALFQFNYQWKLAVDTSPPTHYMSRDNAVTASITKLYVNKVDATGHDMSLFLSEITAGDDLTLHDHNDADINIAFTASAAATLTGNAFTIPVTFVKQNGYDFTDNENVNIHWVSESKSVTAPSGLEKVVGNSNPVNAGSMDKVNVFSLTAPAPEIKDKSKIILAGGPDAPENATVSVVMGLSLILADPHPTKATHTTAQLDSGISVWKLIDNPTTVLKRGNINLMPTGDPTQENVTEVEGVKYKSYTTAEIAALPDYVLGTFLFDSTLNSLVQCTDATVGANVWEAVGGGEPEKGGIAHSATTDYVVGDIVSVLKETYQCITAHTAKAFDAADWLQIWNSEQIQAAPAAPADISATPTQSEVQAVLDYSKNINAALITARVFVKPLESDIEIQLIHGETSFGVKTNYPFVVEQDGTTVTHPAAPTGVVISGLNDATFIKIYFTNARFRTFTFNGVNNIDHVKFNIVGEIASMERMCSDLTKMTQFECTADLSNITNFLNTWYKCSGLTSFPAIDTSSGTNFGSTWYECSGLTSFPPIDISSGTNFLSTWYKCAGLTSFPPIDISSGTNFSNTWSECSGLTSFPPIDISSGTNFLSCWEACTKLICFTKLNFKAMLSSKGDHAFSRCSALVEPGRGNRVVRIGNNAFPGEWTNPNPCP